MYSERLPSRFPVGTKLVIEGRRDRTGRLRVHSRYVEFPDGRYVDLLAGDGPSFRRRNARARPRQPRPAANGR